MSAPIPSAFSKYRTLLLVSTGIVSLLLLLTLLAWWLLPRWAPYFVIRYAPMPDMVFRAATEGNASSYMTAKRLAAMGKEMGTRMTSTMVGHLHDSDDTAKHLALEVLGKLQDPQATEAVIAVLTDHRESLTMEAIATLGKIGDARAIPHLLPFFSDKDLSTHAALAMQELPNTAVADAIRPLMEQRQECNVLLALYDNQDPRVPAWLDAEMRIAVPIITPHRDEPVWQQMAAYVLGSSPAGHDLAEKALADVSPAVRKRAVRGVADIFHIPLSESGRAAVLRLLDDADPSIIEAAAWACARHELKPAIPILLRLLDHPDPAVRQAATHGFGGTLFDEAATTRLIALTTDPDEQVRIGAVKALGWIAEESKDQRLRVVPALIQALADGSPRVRKATLKGLDGLRFTQDLQVTARLVDLLDDPDNGVRREAHDQLSGYRRMLTDAQRTKLDAAHAKILASEP